MDDLISLRDDYVYRAKSLDNLKSAALRLERRSTCYDLLSSEYINRDHNSSL